MSKYCATLRNNRAKISLLNNLKQLKVKHLQLFIAYKK